MKTIDLNAPLDVTKTLQEQLRLNKELAITGKGVHYITAPLKLQSGQRLVLDEGVQLAIFPELLPTLGNTFNFFEATKQDDIELTLHGSLLVGDLNSKTFFTGVKSRLTNNLRVYGLNVENAAALNIDSGKGFEFKAIKGRGRKWNNNNDMGILLSFCSDILIDTADLFQYNSCIQAWGFDSNPLKAGAIDKVTGNYVVPNGVTNLKVVRAKVGDCLKGGIWGSKVTNFQVGGLIEERCEVSNCGDVGIDFEGVENGMAQNNIVNDCKNGCLTTFFNNKHIQFLQNICTNQNPVHPLARIYGETIKNGQNNQDVTFIENTFTCTNGIGYINQFGQVDLITFKKNVLNNVVVDFSKDGNKQQAIGDNKINITFPLTDYGDKVSRSTCIKVGKNLGLGGRTMKVETNTITVTDPKMTGVDFIVTDQVNQQEVYPNNNIITGTEKKYKVTSDVLDAKVAPIINAYSVYQPITAANIERAGKGLKSLLIKIGGKLL